MTRVLLRLVLLGVLGAAAVPARVSAQPAPAPAPVDKKQVARQYTEAGLAAAKIGDYDTAIGFYQKAYQLVPHPTLVFNIAEAQRLAGRPEQALSLYRRYLSDAPNGPLAQDAHDRIAEIDARKAEEARKAAEARQAEEDRKAAEARQAEDDRKAAEARQAEDDRKAAEARKAEQARQDRERTAAAASPSAAPGATQATGSPEAAAPPGRNLRLAGIATGAGGVVGLAVGIGFAIHGRTLNNRVSNKPGIKYDMDTDTAGHRANTIAYIGSIGGTVLVAAGAALYWWGYTQGRPAERVSIAPVVSDRLAGLVVAGTWR